MLLLYGELFNTNPKHVQKMESRSKHGDCGKIRKRGSYVTVNINRKAATFYKDLPQRMPQMT